MSNENVNGSGVWLSGGDLGSGQPGGIQRRCLKTQRRWQTTLTLAPNASYTYKYRNGYFPNSWQGGQEDVEGTAALGNIIIDYLMLSADTVLTAQCFGDCLTCE